jgi:hypothetical protein
MGIIVSIIVVVASVAFCAIVGIKIHNSEGSRTTATVATREKRIRRMARHHALLRPDDIRYMRENGIIAHTRHRAHKTIHRLA